MNWRHLLFKTDLIGPLRFGFRRIGGDDGTLAIPWHGPFVFRKGRWSRDLFSVIGQLEAIVRANASLVRGLELAALDAPRPSVQRVLIAIRDDLANGFSLSESMHRLYRFFPRYHVDIVRMGEKSGRLGDALGDVGRTTANVIERQYQMARVMQYLALVVLTNVVIIGFVTLYVFPQFRLLFDEFESKPVIYGVLESIGFVSAAAAPSPGIAGIWIAVFGVIVAFCLFFVNSPIRFLRRRTGLLRAASEASGFIGSLVPGFRQLLVKRNVGYSAHVLERLLEAGVPIQDALVDVAELDINGLYAERWYRIQRNVVRGSTLSEAIDRERGFPQGFRDMIRIGEQSGRLPEALGRIGALYQRQAQRASRVLIDTVFPIAIIILGGVVYLFYGTVFSTLVQLYEAFFNEL